MVRSKLALVIQIVITLHAIKNTGRKEAYIKRHSKEDWSKSNIASPAWMSRYIVCEKPTLKSAAGNANKN